MLVRVEDATGAIIPGATVKVVSVQQPELSGQTAGAGEILFSNLIPGVYEVTASFAGFKTATAKGIDVRLGERLAVTIRMEPGAVETTVEVVGAAAGIDLSTTETGGSIEDTLYHTIPLQRGLGSAFFLAPGVVHGGGTCGEIGQTVECANPSMGGASGFENLYLIDGVNITHGGFGGFGTVSRDYGSLGSGTTTSFIKEVEIKTGGYDAQYGQSLGGIVNVITKTGGNELHGAVFAYFAPARLEAARRQANASRVENFQVFETDSISQLDFGAEVGGYIVKDRLFFFGSLNPAINRYRRRAPWSVVGPASGPPVFDQFTYGPGDCDPTTAGPAGNPLAGCADLGEHTLRERTINYALKLTGQITQDHRVEASIFGDPTIRKFGPWGSLSSTLEPTALVPVDFVRLDFSNLNFALRYNGVITPTWLINSHFANNHNRFENQQLFPAYNVDDRTVPGVSIVSGGVGFFEDSFSDDKTFSVDNTNIINALGTHELREGFYFSTNNFTGLRRRTGVDFPVVADPLLVDPADVGRNTFGATFRLISCQVTTGTPDCNGRAPAAFQGATDTFVAIQTRGDNAGNVFDTIARYTAAYIQDDWRWNKHLTLKLGVRWEQERLIGTQGTAYTYSNSWGPRLGVIVDPWGNRKTKLTFNFARYFQRLPNDLTLRVFSGESSYLNLEYWVEPDKVIRPDQGHYVGLIACPVSGTGYVCDPATGLRDTDFPRATLSGSSGIPAEPGTKMTFQDEVGIGIQHEFPRGFVLGGRYIDRRLKRITEDSNGVSLEQAAAGMDNIPFILVNPSATADFFTNPFLVPTATGPCFAGTEDIVPGQCFHISSGDPGPDGIADGLPDPVRRYQAVEIILERRYRDNWQFFANWRIAKLQGNFEGAFRNDNGQTDPGITSLFDFIDTPGALSLYSLGDLPNDRRHVINAYGSYLINEGWANGLNLGFGVRVQSGRPITELLAHPLFENEGEIPCTTGNTSVLDVTGTPIYSTPCESTGRGSFGRTPFTGGVDLHGDYPVRLTERFTLRGAIDFFNVFNSQRSISHREFKESVPGLLDPDFNTPSEITRPFNLRFAVRLEF